MAEGARHAQITRINTYNRTFFFPTCSLEATYVQQNKLTQIYFTALISFLSSVGFFLSQLQNSVKLVCDADGHTVPP